MKFKDPCDTCIIKVMCSELCNEKRKYGNMLPIMEIIYTITITMVLSLSLIIILSDVLYNLNIRGLYTGILHFVGCIIIALIISFLLHIMDNYFSEKKKKYQKQKVNSIK